MALEMKPVQVRLPDEAYDALKMLADLDDKDLGEKARELLTKVLLGEVHAAKIQAARFARIHAADNLREGAVAPGNGGRKGRFRRHSSAARPRSRSSRPGSRSYPRGARTSG
jgi:hypothetical protein